VTPLFDEDGVFASTDAIELVLQRAIRSTLFGANDRLATRSGPACDRTVLMSEHVYASRRDREHVAELLFEAFGAPGVGVIPQSLLTMLACGRINGTAVDVGLHSTRVAPVINGRVARDAVQCVPVGGLSSTQYLSALLAEARGAPLDAVTVNALKEEHAFVVPAHTSRRGIEAAMKDVAPRSGASFALPDGKSIDVGASALELAKCTELLFDVSAFDPLARVAGLADTLFCAVTACPADVRAAVLSSVCVGGGGSATRGFDARLGSEVREILRNGPMIAPPPASVVKPSVEAAGLGDDAGADALPEQPVLTEVVSAPTQRRHTVWLGG
jgi:actin-related protein